MLCSILCSVSASYFFLFDLVAFLLAESVYIYFCPNHYSFFCLLHIFNTHPRTQRGRRLATVAAGSSTEANQGRVPAKPGFTSAEPRRWTHPQWDKTTHAHTHTYTHKATCTYTAPVVCLLWSQQFRRLTGGLVCFLRHKTETERDSKTNYNKQSGSTIMQEAMCERVFACVCVSPIVCTAALQLQESWYLFWQKVVNLSKTNGRPLTETDHWVM